MQIGTIVRVFVALAVATSAFAQGGPQSPRIQMPRPGTPMPPRDTSARPTAQEEVGTARLSGRVTAADSGQPLRRATVSALPTRQPEANRRGGFPGPPRVYSARTDEEGRFTITAVPAGEYSVTARRSGYVDQQYGQATSNAPGRMVSVTDGATVGPLDFRLQRGGVITGRVIDEGGEPAERAQVRVLRAQRLAGQVRYVPAGAGDSTDDLGQYRIFGLAPGEYLVMAEPGDRRPFFMATPAVQGAETDAIPTYGPGTVNPAEAMKVQVQAGVEAAMDIQLVTAKVATIRGQVLTSKGQPLEGGFVRMQPQGAVFVGGMGQGGPIRQGGQYEVAGVPPGTYTLMVEQMMRGGPDGPDEDGPPPEGAMQTVTVEGEDLVVPLTTSPGSTARGRVIVEGGDPSALADRTLRISGVPTQPIVMFGSMVRGRVAPDLSFTATGLRGSLTLALNGLPDGWWVKDVRIGGQPALAGFDFGNGRSIGGVEIVVSGSPSGLTGTVTLPTGGKADDYAVVVFPEDEQRWEQVGMMRGQAQVVRPGLDGAFKVPVLRPGSYYVLAVPATQADWSVMGDPDHLRTLAGRARTVEVKEGQLTPVTLTLVER
ncbi:hypothetical protein TBR22_A11500 [Luteitalea sp. TBR-22]|uniref:carboxypeptidase-like regulatory domain-containing protein n=1 Tax=Luteitalea sp. TBR-22 TaxID=2802971 RepID=UPI001EF47DC9|nr:carboxypeptidase-like regulatory domain-containing protein [Luteitalea sp. TBR-22]BCS31946.2 hypothetical protein TBR22_A11500 [Luteitalea sp. TBR-22]